MGKLSLDQKLAAAQLGGVGEEPAAALETVSDDPELAQARAVAERIWKESEAEGKQNRRS